jgi:hypothetical protein
MGFFDDHQTDPIRELSPEHVAYLRRVLEVHANRAPTGLCQVCRVRSCADWRDAFDCLAVAGQPMTEPNRWQCVDQDGPP